MYHYHPQIFVLQSALLAFQMKSFLTIINNHIRNSYYNIMFITKKKLKPFINFSDIFVTYPCTTKKIKKERKKKKTVKRIVYTYGYTSIHMNNLSHFLLHTKAFLNCLLSSDRKTGLIFVTMTLYF